MPSDRRSRRRADRGTARTSTLPMPWATKSWLASERELSGLGAASLTPAPWMSTSAATANAPVSTLDVRSPSCGRAGVGRPLGNRRRRRRPARSTRNPRWPPRRWAPPVRSTPRTGRAGRPTAPVATRAQRPRPAWSTGRCGRDGGPGPMPSRARRPRHLGPEEVGQLTEHDVRGHARQEPDHHRVRHEPRVAAEAQDSRDDHERAGQDRQQEQDSRAIGLQRRR